MKYLSLAFILATIPSIAMAHEGHGGVGLFHHFTQLTPAIVLVAIVAFIYWKRSK
ncbi:hypothetical protein H5123_05640 [Shewanella sp. SR43-4]|jgi:hypothetical protein|uniref:Uncharacterized protein n=1 Tax=Shewanella vesiculosa TaxID=518738 RepID=A0ABV0FN53_9GAMM|nr:MULTISPECIES: hypothetical protein [Shewanella]MBB1317119.1 hypothetical protein [Shewanella sp. SR43-4]MBB1322000.1 hypothetical protein [Shewanella sp. SR43-8]MBB1389154.1 hypothetical protein [Shewanella sp. SG44-6]MBB1476290.1 hypothetical protein [Shewanella sp. SG41-3]UJL43740.1 hypothetical protein KDH10_001083 [Shewanella vesiculosa]|tara:strand:- start:13760 stop:13924 length:165 start_codon:yes stop_codon:yes gene_type:complete